MQTHPCGEARPFELPGDYSLNAFLSTSSTKKLVADFNGSYSRDFENSSLNYNINYGLTYKPISNLRISPSSPVSVTIRMNFNM